MPEDVFDIDDGDDCPHDEVVPCEGNPTYGRCTQCGDDTFPLFDETEVERFEEIAEEIFSYIIRRFSYVPINLQPEVQVKADLVALLARRGFGQPVDQG